MALPGVDYLGGCKFEKAMLQSHPNRWCAGIFLRTFGDAKKTIIKMCESGKFSEIVIHTEPFDRSHAYPIAPNKKRIIADFKWLQSIAVRFPGTEILGSPFCEHNHKASSMAPLFKELQRVAPSVTMVNSIWKGQVVPGVITEIHLENSKPKAKPQGAYMVSLDGFGGKGEGGMTDTDLEAIIKRYPDARQFRIWDFRMNGKFGWKDRADVKNRKHWPDSKYLNSRIKTLKWREGGITWPSTQLYKPCADDHGDPAPTKDNKLIVILPGSNKKEVKVFDSNGNHIDTLRSPKDDPEHNGDPKGIRYYSTKYAYEVANQAVKNTGSSLVRVGNSPLTDGYLRSGRFR